MNIGQRLRAIREAKGLSQGHIEEHTGLFRCYVSRVEGGHTVPKLGTLEKWAKALDVELYQLFYEGRSKPAVREDPVLLRREMQLFNLVRQMQERNKSLLIGLAREIVKRRSEARRRKA